MAINDPTSRAEEWLYTTLSGDATITSLVGNRIYEGNEPQENRTYPVIIFSWAASGPDVRPAGKPFVYANLLYLVKAIDKAGSTRRDIVDRFTTLLDNAAGAVPSGGNVIFCRRETPWRLPGNEVAAGVTYAHVGGMYRLWVQ